MNLWATTKSNGKGWQRNVTSDGYAFTALGYLSSWQGGIEQSNYDTLAEKYTPDKDLSAFVNYGATAIKYLDDCTQEEIKQEIMDNGSIYAAYSHVLITKIMTEQRISVRKVLQNPQVMQ